MSPIAESGVAICSIDCWMFPCPDCRDGEEVDELVDDLLAELVVLEHEPEDRDERDRQREEREEHAVGDRRRVLRAAIREHVLDRARQRSHDAAHDSADVLEGPPCESLDPSGGLGGGVAHPPECTEHVAATGRERSDGSRAYARRGRPVRWRRYAVTGSRFPFTRIGGIGSTIARGAELAERRLADQDSADRRRRPAAAPRGSRRRRRRRACDGRASLRRGPRAPRRSTRRRGSAASRRARSRDALRDALEQSAARAARNA